MVLQFIYVNECVDNPKVHLQVIITLLRSNVFINTSKQDNNQLPTY